MEPQMYKVSGVNLVVSLFLQLLCFPVHPLRTQQRGDTEDAQEGRASVFLIIATSISSRCGSFDTSVKALLEVEHQAGSSCYCPQPGPVPQLEGGL